MQRAGAIAALLLILFDLTGVNAMATTPLPNLNNSLIISPVCVVSGLAEDKVQALQALLCEDVARLLSEKGKKVEVLALNDTRISDAGRVVVGLRFDASVVNGVGTMLTMVGQVRGDGRRIPAAAQCALFDPDQPIITPGVREGLRKVLRENGLL
jgi:hypothetical protein